MDHERIVGCLLGTAVGDALGLPYEGLTRSRAARMLGPPDRYRFCFQRGMVSDDTEHTCMVAQALIAAAGDEHVFRDSLSWRFRWWLLGVPAGVGFATLRAIVRLWFGIGPEQSGVFSAGNGPAMRSGIIGVAIEDRRTVARFTRIASHITHTDPKAANGALAVALAAHMAARQETIIPDEYLQTVKATMGPDGDELITLLSKAVVAVSAGLSTSQFADSLGLLAGVSGYVNHTVPIAIHAWLRFPDDLRTAVTAVIECGGDTDTTAAIAGGIVGAAVGKAGIPHELLDGLIEWPRTNSWIQKLGIQLEMSTNSGQKARPISLPLLATIARNLFFVAVVLFHGLRRLFPPY